LQQQRCQAKHQDKPAVYGTATVMVVVFDNNNVRHDHDIPVRIFKRQKRQF